MTPVFLTGLVLPVAVLILAGLVALLLGIGWAATVLAVGLGAIIGVHLWQIHRLVRWAEAPVDTPVPEARQAWGIAFSALHRRSRTRTLHHRDLATTIERFRNAVEALPDGMVIIDAVNRIQWANARAQAHLGLDLAKDIGRPLLNLLRQPEIASYFDAGDFTDAVVIDSLRGAGTTLSIQVVPFDVDERLLISRDITQLEAIARMRRDFIADVSHELKTPLTVVRGFLETLQDIELEPRRRTQYLQLMAEQAGSMQRLVDDLLRLSALESEQSIAAETSFAVIPLLLEVSADAKALSGGRHTIALDVGDAAIVSGSRDELASAFGNLVSNAIRYTPDGGTITLCWHVDAEGRGAFSVADTGIGIAAEHIPRLTERFYRVDRSRSRATGGTGLGLAIVKHVLQRHQAELDVTSEPGQGSTFTVFLPARRIRPAEDSERIADAITASTPGTAPSSSPATSS
ncbi:MAG: phosphate regulon sensor histidine kinase PhoR [Betaproteobacteria bacterium]|nr:phosphate regulon sensor histidine kinase PhoR [Betaproteobacteria bacterium]